MYIDIDIGTSPCHLPPSPPRTGPHLKPWSQVLSRGPRQVTPVGSCSISGSWRAATAPWQRAETPHKQQVPMGELVVNYYN